MVQEILLGGGGCLYFQTSHGLWALVGIDAIGSAKHNCRENCLRKTALDCKADKPRFLVRSRGEGCSPSPRAEMPPCQAPRRAGPGGAGLKEGASLCDRLFVHIPGGAAKRSRCLWQPSSSNFSREPPATGEGRSVLYHVVSGQCNREGRGRRRERESGEKRWNLGRGGEGR